MILVSGFSPHAGYEPVLDEPRTDRAVGATANGADEGHGTVRLKARIKHCHRHLRAGTLDNRRQGHLEAPRDGLKPAIDGEWSPRQ